MIKGNFKTTKMACYTAYFTMSSIFCLPPLLFVTFREMYGISWTQLGSLVLVNFFTQLIVDLIFTVFSKKFNVGLTLKIMPIITSAGLLIYAFFPLLLPDLAYAGLLVGTVIFSVSAGLSEVLLSPTIARIPSDNAERDMSALHSLYAFGVFSVVVIGTLYLRLVGEEYWSYLAAFFAMLPLIPAVLFMISPMPDMKDEETVQVGGGAKKNAVGILLFVICIFLGSCAENIMSNWISGFMEAELHIDKTLGDVFGVALFAVLLGITRFTYSKWSKSISKTLLIGMIGASACYLVAGLSSFTAAVFIACVLNGVFSAMLWPGTLIMMDEKMHGVGVSAYALMAAGGDLGASVGPQLLGIVADSAGLQTGMLVSSVFPILGIFAVILTIRYFKNV